MSRRKRRHFSPEDKIKILRLHLREGRPISELCDEHGIHPTLFYQWQKTFFENAKGSGLKVEEMLFYRQPQRCRGNCA
jgi:transposase-like protein